MYKYILVIGAEILTRVVNWKDRSSCVLFGDGAGAAVIGPVPSGYGILGGAMGADGTGGDFLTIPASGVEMPPTDALRETVWPMPRWTAKKSINSPSKPCLTQLN